MVLVAAAAGGDGDVVEASGHQRVKDTLGAGLGDRDSVKRPLTVAQGHQVTVHLTWSRTPRHAEEVHATVVTDRDLAHCSRDWGGRKGRLDNYYCASFSHLDCCSSCYLLFVR